MRTYSIAEASEQLPQLIAEAERGEEVAISDGARVVALLHPPNRETEAEFFARVRAETLAGPSLSENAVDLVRRMRDGDPS